MHVHSDQTHHDLICCFTVHAGNLGLHQLLKPLRPARNQTQPAEQRDPVPKPAASRHTLRARKQHPPATHAASSPFPPNKARPHAGCPRVPSAPETLSSSCTEGVLHNDNRARHPASKLRPGPPHRPRHSQILRSCFAESHLGNDGEAEHGRGSAERQTGDQERGGAALPQRRGRLWEGAV
jgi:hypothetical protein